MNIDLITIIKVLLTLHVIVALKLNQFYYSAMVSQIFVLNSINKVLSSITNLDDYTLVKILLLGDQNYMQDEKSYIIDVLLNI